MFDFEKFKHNFFYPKKKENNFNEARYLQDLDAGKFRGLMNLGVSEKDGGTWLLGDLVETPNVLNVGGMGSGKSSAANFSVHTWLCANSDETINYAHLYV